MKMHLTKQLLFPVRDERLKTNDSRTRSSPVCVRVRCVCMSSVHAGCVWWVWMSVHVRDTPYYVCVCACEYRVWCACCRVCASRGCIFFPPLALAWASSLFGSLRARRADSLEKTLMLGGMGSGGEGDDRGGAGWMASPTRWA